LACYNVPMHEYIQFPPIDLEVERKVISEKIRTAKQHALDLEIEGDLIEQYTDMTHVQYLPSENQPADFNKEKLEAMEARVLQAIAQVKTLPEFRILMKEAGFNDKFAMDMLAHENAHANVAEQKSDTIDLHGYGIIFFQEHGQVVSATPLVLNDKKDGATSFQYLQDEIEVLNAPNEYGNKNSEDDDREIQMRRDTLEKYYSNK